MTWLVFLASALLSAVAAAGVLLPFGRSRSLALDRASDPLEDERAGLLRTLEDLDEERATGQISDEAYRALRRETEGRAVIVLRTLEAGGDLEAASELHGLRPRTPPRQVEPDGSDGGPTPARRRTLALVASALVIGVVAVVLAGAIRSRSPGDPLSGTVQGGLAFFEQRVADHPNDVAARLDLGQRYLETGDGVSAVQQYLAVLQLDPKNAEAHTRLGFLLYQAGRAADGLREVQAALAVDPTYPEALYDQAVILLKGLDRPEEAATSLRAYLAAAPFGSHHDDAQRLLDEAEGSGS
jgi:tetratricopeptide (TPR) repeat protein